MLDLQTKCCPRPSASGNILSSGPTYHMLPSSPVNNCILLLTYPKIAKCNSQKCVILIYIEHWVIKCNYCHYTTGVVGITKIRLDNDTLSGMWMTSVIHTNFLWTSSPVAGCSCIQIWLGLLLQVQGN